MSHSTDLRESNCLRLGLIDYGMGNLHSVQQAFNRLDLSLEIVRSPDDLENIEALIH